MINSTNLLQFLSSAPHLLFLRVETVVHPLFLLPSHLIKILILFDKFIPGKSQVQVLQFLIQEQWTIRQEFLLVWDDLTLDSCL